VITGSVCQVIAKTNLMSDSDLFITLHVSDRISINI